MSDLVERWPGYTEQSWAERFAELDRRFSKKQDTAVKAICQLSSITSARITALETALAEAEGRVIARVQAELQSLLDDVERVGNPISKDHHEGQQIGIAQAMARIESAIASDPLLDMPGNGKEG